MMNTLDGSQQKSPLVFGQETPNNARSCRSGGGPLLNYVSDLPVRSLNPYRVGRGMLTT